MLLRGGNMVIHARVLKRSILFLCVGIAFGISLKMLCFEGVLDVFLNNRQFTVVCDAGHGAPDGGAVALDGTEEKDINLAITKKLCEVLEAKGINTITTRDGDSGIYDEDAATIREKKVSDMHKRVQIINNANADLFLSIHMNSFTDASANGIHIFYGKEDEKTKELAEEIQRSIVDVTLAKPHSVKEVSKSLYLMKNAKIPSILIECGFMSNPQEAQLLQNEEYQAKIAWAIADAIEEYIGKNEW